MTAKQTTITVTQAASELGLSEDQFRLLLKPLYPAKWETMKRISMRNFEAIAQALQEKALEQDENVVESSDPDVLEPDAQAQYTSSSVPETLEMPDSGHSESDFEQKISIQVDNTLSEFPNQEQVAEVLPDNHTLESFLGTNFEQLDPSQEPETNPEHYKNDSEHSESDSGSNLELPIQFDENTLTENKKLESEDISQSSELSVTDETTDLTTQQVEQKVRMQLDLALPQQILDLNKISRALALVAADETVIDFKEIYIHRVNTGINSFLSDFAQQTLESIDQLRGSDTADFLAEVKKTESQNGRDTAVAQILNLI